jgi:hypothetical protein
MDVELPEFAVVPTKPCACGCTTFCNFFQVGPNIGGKCRDCLKEKRWFSRFELGLSRTERRRKGSVSRSEMLARWGHRCAWCGISAHALKDYGEELVDGHIVPYHTLHSLPDIRNHPANIVPSCHACNDFAHKIGNSERLLDLSILLHAAVAYAAGVLGEHEDEHGGETDDDPGAVRPEIRRPGLVSIPMPRERQATLGGAGTSRSDDGWGDDPEAVA